MMSFGPELLVIEMMGVIGSNWRINDVAETPASFNLHDISLKLCTHRDHKPHGLVQEELAVKVGHHNVLSPEIQKRQLEHARFQAIAVPKVLTMSTRSYFCAFILLTALTPSTATSIWHPNFSKNLELSFRQTVSSSTSNTRGGTAQPGTADSRRPIDGGGGGTCCCCCCCWCARCA